ARDRHAAHRARREPAAVLVVTVLQHGVVHGHLGPEPGDLRLVEDAAQKRAGLHGRLLARRGAGLPVAVEVRPAARGGHVEPSRDPLGLLRAHSHALGELLPDPGSCYVAAHGRPSARRTISCTSRSSPTLALATRQRLPAYSIPSPTLSAGPR